MNNTILAIVVAIGLAVGNNAAQACPCTPDLGIAASDVGGGHLSKVNGMSIAVLNDECYVMYAGSKSQAVQDNPWHLYVKKMTCDKGWVLTNGGNRLNWYPDKATNPYFYEFKLIVFQDHLYAVFAETDGDGDSNGNGHKIVHVKRYDQSTDTWEFVEGNPTKDTRLGLSRPFYPGGNVSHWSYFNTNGVVATNDALYVSWSEYVDPGNAPSGKPVIRKYSKQAGSENFTWTTLSGNGLPDCQPEPNHAGITGSIGLGEYQGKPVLAYAMWSIRNDAPQVSLRVAMYDEAGKTWTQISRNWLNNSENTYAGGGLLVKHQDQLYIIWKESTYNPNLLNNPPYKLFVKVYGGDDPATPNIEKEWGLVGTGAIRSSSVVSNPLLLSDNNGLTAVSWDANELYVDRFNGTAWETIGTSGQQDVVAPYCYYVYSPSIDAVSYGCRIYLAWQVNDGNPGTLIHVAGID